MIAGAGRERHEVVIAEADASAGTPSDHRLHLPDPKGLNGKAESTAGGASGKGGYIREAARLAGMRD